MPRPDVFRCDAACCWRACSTGRPDEIAAGAPRGAVLPPGGRGRAALFLFLFASSPSSPNFSKCFSGNLLIEIFSEVSGQLQRRVRTPSPDRSPDRQRAPSRAFAPMAALREPALLNAWEGVRSCSQEMTVPPLCQTSRDHRRMMIVILRMIVPATGRVGETAIPAGCGLVSFCARGNSIVRCCGQGGQVSARMHLQNAP